MTKRAERRIFKPDWKVAPIKEASSDGKETFELLEDGSVLATGKSGDRSTYFLKAEAGGGKWKALRLEALLHTSMQKKGPGRNLTNANPNFVLTEILVYRRNGDLREPIPFNRAWASFSQSNFGAGQLIDGLDSRKAEPCSPFRGGHHVFRIRGTLDLEKPARLEIEETPLRGGRSVAGQHLLATVSLLRKEKQAPHALAGKAKQRMRKNSRKFSSRKARSLLKRRIGEAEGLLAKIKPRLPSSWSR